MDCQFERARNEEIKGLMKEAERGKADVFRPPGKDNHCNKSTWEIDEDFFQFGAHIDKGLNDKLKEVRICIWKNYYQNRKS